MDDLRLLQHKWRQGSHLGLHRFIECCMKNTILKPSTLRETNYPRQLLTDLLTTERLHNFQVDSSEALKHVLQVYVQATTFGDKTFDYCRLMLLARRHLEQKIQESHFKARNRDEDRPAMGAPRRGKAKGKGKEHAKHNSERGDCCRWITKGQCSCGEACAFKHDPNKKGEGKGRSRSLSPAGSPNWNWKVMEEVVMTEMRTQKLSGKSPSGEANKLKQAPFVRSSRKEVATSCNYWHVPGCTQFKFPAGRTPGDKRCCKHTAKSAD